MKLFIVLIIISSLSFSSCEKLFNTIWVTYDETGCADRWGGSSNKTEKEKIKAVKIYLEEQEIRVSKVEMTKDGKLEYCKACHCKTGNRIHAKINENDLDKAKNEGFYR